jgi:hypothetical protein
MHKAFLEMKPRALRVEHIVNLWHFRAIFAFGLGPSSKATAFGGGRLLDQKSHLGSGKTTEFAFTSFVRFPVCYCQFMP